MTQGERIAELRKALSVNGKKMTLERFGEKIGLKKSALSHIENGMSSLTEQTLKSICREFGVSEAWLRDGEGEMFVQRTRSQIIADFANDVMEDVDESFRKRFVEALSKLSVEDWEVLNKIVDELSAKKEG